MRVFTVTVIGIWMPFYHKKVNCYKTCQTMTLKLFFLSLEGLKHVGLTNIPGSVISQVIMNTTAYSAV